MKKREVTFGVQNVDEYSDGENDDDKFSIDKFPDEVKIPNYRKFTEFLLNLKHSHNSHLAGSEILQGDDYARETQAELIFVLVCDAMYNQWDTIQKKWDYSRVFEIGKKMIANAPEPREALISDDEAMKMYRRCNENAAEAARRLGYNEKYFARRIKKLKEKRSFWV